MIDISHEEANGLLDQVESALDKVTGSVTSRPSSFTGRLLGTLTQTVKFVADVSIVCTSNIHLIH